MAKVGYLWVIFRVLPTLAELTSKAFANGDIEDPRRLLPAGFNTHTIQSSGLTREYSVYVPPGLSNDNPPRGMMVVFHGLGERGACDPELEPYGFEVQSEADAKNFVVICPLGYLGEGSPEEERGWNVGPCCGYSQEVGGAAIDDVLFVQDLLDHLNTQLPSSAYNVPYPLENVFALGFSTGGLFSYRLGCELTDRFDGIGVHGAAFNWAFGAGDAPWAGQCNSSVKTWNSIGTRDELTTHTQAMNEWKAYSIRVLKCAVDSEVSEAVTACVTCHTFTQCGDSGSQYPASRFCIYNGLDHTVTRMVKDYQWGAPKQAWAFLTEVAVENTTYPEPDETASPNQDESTCLPIDAGDADSTIRLLPSLTSGLAHVVLALLWCGRGIC